MENSLQKYSHGKTKLCPKVYREGVDKDIIIIRLFEYEIKMLYQRVYLYFQWIHPSVLI